MTTPLPADEVAAFWALGIPLEASAVTEEEWHRALGESRVQEVSSYSSMGTAETGWVRTSNPGAPRDQCAVVPPGHVATDTAWSDLRDSRDTLDVCWQPFWGEQASAALAHVTEARRDAFLAECARVLVELEGQGPPGGDEATRRSLLAWLTAREAPPQLEQALAGIRDKALSHLVTGVRARWIDRSARAGFEAVMLSAERGPRDFWGHGNVTRQAAVRLALLRFIVRLVRG